MVAKLFYLHVLVDMVYKSNSLAKFLVLLLTISISYGFSQQTNIIDIESPIKKVTVFITGGEEWRTATVQLKKGRNKLVFKGISTVADIKSVQFSTDKPVNLVSVSSEIDYVTAVEQNSEIGRLQDSINWLNAEMSKLYDEKDAYRLEKELILGNQQIKATQKNLTATELSAMADYIRTRITELNKLLTNYDYKISSLNTRMWQYQNQLYELNYKETIKSNQIIVLLDADSDMNIATDLKYIVSNCGWEANYDLSAENTLGEIKLKYRAKVFNNTGTDWKDVSMVLSTADPITSASAPALQPWYLNYSSLSNGQMDYEQDEVVVVPDNRGYTQYYSNASVPEISQNLEGVMYYSSGRDAGLDQQSNQGYAQPGYYSITEDENISRRNQTVSQGGVAFTQIEVGQISREFEIERKYTIPCDAKPYLVDITSFTLPVTFSYKAVPKMDNSAFLLANIVGWEKLDLVPGPSQVYFANTYVGQSYLNTAHVDDTLRLSFGRDPKIEVSRELKEEFSDKKVVGSYKKDTYTYEIKLKNNRPTVVKIDLFDQVPISQDSDIEVTVNEISEAVQDPITGMLSWIVQLQPGETATYSISFTIKYNKNHTISVKKFRTVSCPSF